MDCGKCTLELDSDGSYTECLGCGKHFHYACSVSKTTWKAKTPELKEEWRCMFCMRNPPKELSQIPVLSEKLSSDSTVKQTASSNVKQQTVPSNGKQQNLLPQLLIRVSPLLSY